MSVNPSLYNGIIPQANDLLSISQGQLLNNFGAIQSLIQTDHTDFPSGTATAGQHDRVSFTVQTSPPAQNLPNRANWVAGQVGMYSALNGTTNQNELYINKTNQATVKQIPATASVLSITSAPGNNIAGWTYLPSGILIKWGSTGVLTNKANVTVNGIAGQPDFAGVMSIQVTTQASGATVVDPNTFVTLLTGWNIPANPYFTVWVGQRTSTTPGNGGCQWLAIGY